jgi:radical SAM superfamily enzyme YgiQ (UPF0313 family)
VRGDRKHHRVLLIFPPVAKPCEPPPGIAVLSGALAAHDIEHALLDANLEGMVSLLEKPPVPLDTWTRRAFRHVSQNLDGLRSWHIYENIDAYKRAVSDLNRLLTVAGGETVRISLADYNVLGLSPVKSQDLLYQTGHPAENPFFAYFSKRLTEIIKHNETTVIGFSLNYLSQALTTFAMIGFLRQEFPEITIILGGSLVTSWLRGGQTRGLFNGLVDHCVAGAGEYQLLALLGKRPKQKPIIKPCYDSLPMNDYLAPGRILPYRSSIGCYWGKCSFCPEKVAEAEGGPLASGPLAKEAVYSPLAPERATSELQSLADHVKPNMIHLVDNAVSPAFMQAIAKQPPGAPWYGFARITPHLADPGFCKVLSKSGCVMLKLGLESGDQAVLDALHKGITLETASRALQNLKEAGIATYVYLLFGTPPETRVQARRTLDFLAAHALEVQFLNVAIFNLPLSSPEAAGLETASFYEGDLSLYTDFRHPRGWDRRLVREFLDAEFKKHPAIRLLLNNQPPLFTSNHAPFFTLSKSKKGGIHGI